MLKRETFANSLNKWREDSSIVYLCIYCIYYIYVFAYLTKLVESAQGYLGYNSRITMPALRGDWTFVTMSQNFDIFSLRVTEKSDRFDNQNREAKILPSIHPTINYRVVHAVGHCQPVYAQKDLLDVWFICNLWQIRRHYEVHMKRKPAHCEYYYYDYHHFYDLKYRENSYQSKYKKAGSFSTINLL